MILPNVFPAKEVELIIQYFREGQSGIDRLDLIDACYAILGYGLYEAFHSKDPGHINKALAIKAFSKSNYTFSSPDDPNQLNLTSSQLNQLEQTNMKAGKGLPPWLVPLVIKIIEDIINNLK